MTKDAPDTGRCAHCGAEVPADARELAYGGMICEACSDRFRLAELRAFPSRDADGGRAMTKSELRRRRKAASAAGEPLVGDLALDRDDQQPMESSESPRGRMALDRWARRYDESNGAPEGDWDR